MTRSGPNASRHIKETLPVRGNLTMAYQAAGLGRAIPLMSGW
jgi:hypothetical protein